MLVNIRILLNLIDVCNILINSSNVTLVVTCSKELTAWKVFDKNLKIVYYPKVIEGQICASKPILLKFL